MFTRRPSFQLQPWTASSPRGSQQICHVTSPRCVRSDSAASVSSSGQHLAPISLHSSRSRYLPCKLESPIQPARTALTVCGEVPSLRPVGHGDPVTLRVFQQEASPWTGETPGGYGAPGTGKALPHGTCSFLTNVLGGLYFWSPWPASLLSLCLCPRGLAEVLSTSA